MSWDLEQKHYIEFIDIWQRSKTSCEALERLLASDSFPSSIKSKGFMQLVQGHDTLFGQQIQGIANALRRKGVTLQSLKMDKRNRKAPKKSAPVETAAHLNFETLSEVARWAKISQELMDRDGLKNKYEYSY